MGKTALITGASSGIGRAYAHVFAENGYGIIAVGRNRASLEALSLELQTKGRRVVVITADLSNIAEVLQLYEATHTEIIDIIVNNAGFGQYGLFHEADLHTQLHMIAVNVTALTALTKLYLPDMFRRNSGTIINVASTAAFEPVPLMNVYGATKSYVLSLTEAVASELEGTNVHVMAVCPGSTESEFHKRAGSERRPNDRTKLMSAREVAEATYRGMLKGKRIVVPGFGNKMISQAHRFLPRNVLTNLAKRIYLKRKR